MVDGAYHVFAKGGRVDTGMEAIEWLEGFLASYGGAVFVITHDRHFIDSVANRVIELDGGRVTEYTPDLLAEVNPYKSVLDLVIDLLILMGISWVLTDLAHLGGHSDLMFVRRIKN